MTSSARWRPGSTPCSTPWTSRSAANDGSSPTLPTSCARPWRRLGPTSRCCGAQRSWSPASAAQLIRDTVAQLSQLTLLVNNLMELARGEEEAGAFGVLRLDEVVTSVVGEARRNYPSVPIELSAVPSKVWGSPDRLHKAFANLVDNAAKWTTPSTSVEVTVGERSVTVRDHGPGVDAQDIPHIFDRFYRSLSARGVPGSGLGLAIAKQAVVAHGGRVEVRDAEGGGAEFIVWFQEPPAS